MNKDDLNVRKLEGPMPKGKKQEDCSYLFKVCGAEFAVYKYQHWDIIWSWESCGRSRRFLRFFNEYTEFKTKRETVEHLEKCLRRGFYVPKEILEDMNLTHYALLRTEKALMEKLEKTRAEIKEYEK